MKSKWLPIIIFGSAHILIATLLFNSGVYIKPFSAAALFFDYAEFTFQGLLVYQDFPMEYPPLALLFFILPRLVTSNINTYAFAFTVEILVFDLIGLLIIASISRRLKVSLWITLGIYTLVLLAIGPIMTGRYDLIPAIMVLLALYTLSLGRQKLSWAILAIGVMTKIYPVVLAPVFLINSLYQRRYRESLYGVITFTATIAVIILPFLWLSPDHFLGFIGYHMQRGLQLESIYASILLMGHTLGLTAVHLEFSFGSWNITTPLSDALAKASMVLTFLSLMAVYWFFYRYRSRSARSDITVVWTYSLLAILVFMITSKVLSPQFIIWLYPLVVPFDFGWRRQFSWILLIIIGLMTFYIFPAHYSELTDQLKPTVIYILLVRNILLFVLAGLLLTNRDYTPDNDEHQTNIQ